MAVGGRAAAVAGLLLIAGVGVVAPEAPAAADDQVRAAGVGAGRDGAGAWRLRRRRPRRPAVVRAGSRRRPALVRRRRRPVHHRPGGRPRQLPATGGQLRPRQAVPAGDLGGAGRPPLPGPADHPAQPGRAPAAGRPPRRLHDPRPQVRPARDLPGLCPPGGGHGPARPAGAGHAPRRRPGRAGRPAGRTTRCATTSSPSTTPRPTTAWTTRPRSTSSAATGSRR